MQALGSRQRRWRRSESSAWGRAPQRSSKPSEGACSALGYIEGETLTFVIREAVGQEAALPKLAAELVQLQVDVIFAGGDAAVRAAKQATRTIPIVMLVSGDPVGSGLVASLNQPGGNVTGVTGLSPRLTARRMEILKQAVPTLSHVAVLFNPDDETKTVDRQQLQVTARALGFRLHRWRYAALTNSNRASGRWCRSGSMDSSC